MKTINLNNGFYTIVDKDTVEEVYDVFTNYVENTYYDLDEYISCSKRVYVGVDDAGNLQSYRFPQNFGSLATELTYEEVVCL